MPANIIWLTIESCRFDATSIGSSEGGPLAKIASQNGARSFGKCHSHGVWTRSSSASILTGTYPSHHRVGENTLDVLPEAIPTVPELLSDIGYQTICLMNGAHVDGSSQLDRGFDIIYQLSKNNILSDVPFRTIIKYILNIRHHGGGLTTKTTKHSTSYMMTDIAKRVLRNKDNSGSPLFLYAHYNDPHHPYTPPKPLFKQVASRTGFSLDEAFNIAIDHNQNFLTHVANGCDIPADELQLLRRLHKVTIRYVESQIQQVVDVANSLKEDTIVVITGDHGELFGEDGLLAHRLSTHSAVSHVPLVVSGPTEIMTHQNDRVQHVDVVSTLLAEQGAETASLQGKDLRTECRKWSVIQRAGERATNTVDILQSINDDFKADSFPLTNLTVFRTDEFKYETAKNHERLVKAPDGQEDVSSRNSEIIKQFRKNVDEFFTNEGKAIATEKRTTELDSETKDRLDRLGYLS